ncbi:F-box/FBD/LRR-repeat protein At1g13570-like [Bidens hawaiensis]|uniref:F-box/FBD/LRR-repeat protein At1g13570-like n=1 Tax=Bidens hawaiensis TaxID=980011 RepID=UPI00404B351C
MYRNKQDAVRTSVLSKEWRYSWRDMPKLVFANDMVKIPSNCVCERLIRYMLANVKFQVLLLHNGPTIVEFNISVGDDDMQSEIAQIISCLAKINCVKDFTLVNDKSFYKLSPSFFSLQVREIIYLQDCAFEPPLLFNKFSRLKSITFVSVEVSAKMLQGFLSNCPLLEYICLEEDSQESIHDFVPAGSKFTSADFLQCVPLIQTLKINQYYMKYLCAGGMPHKLPTSLVYLRYLALEVCFVEQNQISSVLCLIRSSPLLEKITIMMYDNERLPPVRQTPHQRYVENLEKPMELELGQE